MIERGSILKPDLVALVFYNNGLEDLVDPLWDRMAQNRAIKSKFPTSVLWPLLRNTAVWNFQLRIRELLRASKANSDTEKNSQTPKDNLNKTIKTLYQINLFHLASEMPNQGTPFVFAIFPVHLDVKGQPANDSPVWAEQIAKENKIATINLLDAVKQGLVPDLNAGYLLPHDSHASALGHSLAGRAMTDFLLQQPAVKVFGQ